MAAKIKSFAIFHAIKKDEIEGIVVKIAIIVPLTKMSLESFLNDFNNYFSIKLAILIKNTLYLAKKNFWLIGKLQRSLFK